MRDIMIKMLEAAISKPITATDGDFKYTVCLDGNFHIWFKEYELKYTAESDYMTLLENGETGTIQDVGKVISYIDKINELAMGEDECLVRRNLNVLIKSTNTVCDHEKVEYNVSHELDMEIKWGDYVLTYTTSARSLFMTKDGKGIPIENVMQIIVHIITIQGNLSDMKKRQKVTKDE